MIQKCKYCKERDLGPVITGLSPDINDLIKNHKIPDTVAEVVYNQLTEISDVGCRINDDFDAIIIQRALKATGLTPQNGTGSSQAAGATAPVASPAPAAE